MIVVNPGNGILLVLKKKQSKPWKKKYGESLNVYDQLKEKSLKKLLTEWFQLYNILEEANLWK